MPKTSNPKMSKTELSKKNKRTIIIFIDFEHWKIWCSWVRESTKIKRSFVTCTLLFTDSDTHKVVDIHKENTPKNDTWF